MRREAKMCEPACTWMRAVLMALANLRSPLATLVPGRIIIICPPLVVRMVGAALQQLDPQLVNCAAAPETACCPATFMLREQGRA